MEEDGPSVVMQKTSIDKKMGHRLEASCGLIDAVYSHAEAQHLEQSPTSEDPLSQWEPLLNKTMRRWKRLNLKASEACNHLSKSLSVSHKKKKNTHFQERRRWNPKSQTVKGGGSNVVYKLISKVIANRNEYFLVLFMNLNVHLCRIDKLLTMHWLSMSVLIICKRDRTENRASCPSSYTSKAYDRVEWNFLDQIMAYGFWY